MNREVSDAIIRWSVAQALVFKSEKELEAHIMKGDLGPSEPLVTVLASNLRQREEASMELRELTRPVVPETTEAAIECAVARKLGEYLDVLIEKMEKLEKPHGEADHNSHG